MKRLGDLANAPVAWLCEHLKQTYVVHVKIGIGAAREDSGLKLKVTQESGYAFVKGNGLMVVDLARDGGGSLHWGHHSLSIKSVPQKFRRLTKINGIRILRRS